MEEVDGDAEERDDKMGRFSTSYQLVPALIPHFLELAYEII